MQLTNNYKLKKPDGTDVVNIDDFNSNSDIIDNALKAYDTQLSDIVQDRIYYCGATTGTNAYTITNSDIAAYKDGLTVRIKIGTASTGASTLNINNLGAKAILDTLGNPIVANGLKAGLPYQLSYNGTNFIVLGKGGGGDATVDQVLMNKKVTVDGGQIVGTMPNNGALNGSLNCGGSFQIPAGYTSGGKVAANSLASQTADATAGAADIVLNKTAYVNGIKVTGNATIESMGGRRFASGTAVSTDVYNQKVFVNYYNQNNTFTNPYIAISGLSFTPSYGIIYYEKTDSQGSDFSRIIMTNDKVFINSYYGVGSGAGEHGFTVKRLIENGTIYFPSEGQVYSYFTNKTFTYFLWE